MRSLFCLLLLSLTPYILSAQLSRTEKKLVKAVDQHEQAAIDLLKESIDINSGTMNFAGVKEVGMLYKERLDALGMETEWVPGEAFGRAGHLVARVRGGKGPKMLLIGHLDTVFEPDSPFQEGKMLNDSTLQGPGVADMKGGDVIIILALQALHDEGLLEKMNIEVVMTGDEEKSGAPLSLSKQNLVEGAKWADIALGFENADGRFGTIVTSRRSSSGWELKVTGNAAHSSQVFTDKVGTGAIYEASRILNSWYETLSKEENLTFNPGVILGGTALEFNAGQNSGTASGKRNVVAQTVVVQGDIRAVSVEQLAMAKKRMQEIAANNYPGTSAELSFSEGYPPLARTAGNTQLLEYYSHVSQDLGYGEVSAVHPRNAGAADVSFTAGHVDMAVDGLGLSGADDHTINETGYITTLEKQAKRAALLMYRLAFDKVTN